MTNALTKAELDRLRACPRAFFEFVTGTVQEAALTKPEAFTDALQVQLRRAERILSERFGGFGFAAIQLELEGTEYDLVYAEISATPGLYLRDRWAANNIRSIFECRLEVRIAAAERIPQLFDYLRSQTPGADSADLAAEKLRDFLDEYT